MATGKTEWLVLGLDKDKRTVTLSAAGQALYGDRALLESALLYLVEKPNGAMEIVTFADFQHRYAEELNEHFGKQANQAAEKGESDRAEKTNNSSIETQ